MRASRLLSILIVLQARGRVSAEALARELEVSVRTIYRDIDQLGMAGVPVYAERGRHGGFALLGGYRTDLTGLDSKEAGAVSLIGAAQAAMDLGLGADATAARLKILASLPLGGGKLAERIAARFHLDPAPWYSRPTPPPALRQLAEAVWSDRQVRMTYESWKKITKRTISPLGLVMKAGAWYVAGAVESSIRIYRVDAIREFKVTDEPASRPRSFDLAQFWTEAASNFETRLRGEPARVRLSPAGVKLLRDVNPAAADAVAAQHPSPPQDAWIEAQIFVESLPHAVREVLRMGAEMEVLEPAGLRTAIAEEARRIARVHGRKRRLRG
ncbi:MAG: helix-turn-helix transcriptional regulator [Steroidobacteraceae bacterium]